MEPKTRLGVNYTRQPANTQVRMKALTPICRPKLRK